MRYSGCTGLLVLLLVAALSGCAERLALSYEPGIEFLKRPDLSAKRVAVLDFMDARDGMPRNAYGIEVTMLIAELPFTGREDLEADRSINDYVTAAFRNELQAIGAQIVATDGVPHVDFLSAQAQVPPLHLTRVDRVVLGRVRYFQWTQAGFAGLIAQPMMPKPRVNAEIQVQVVDPISGLTLWAGEGSASEHIDSVFPTQPEQLSALRVGLVHALEPIIRDPNFLAALAPQ